MVHVWEDGQTAVQLAEQADQGIRGINHLTYNRGALPYGAPDICRLLGELQAMTAKLPQALQQVGRLLENELIDGHVAINDGSDPTNAVADSVNGLAVAARLASELQAEIGRSRSALAWASYTGPEPA